MRGRARPAGTGQATAAVAVQRIAVLLEAGLPPLAAWRAIAGEPDAPAVVRRVAAEASGAHRIASVLADALPGADDATGGWRALHAGWTVAERAGAPLAGSLARLASQLRALEQREREVAVALAGPLATARVVLALPPIGMAFAAAMGIDPLALFATPVGWICLAVGLGLIGAGWLWIRRLVAWARRTEPAPGLALDLAALALAGGLPAIDARRVVATALVTAGLPPALDGVDAVLAFATRAGVPAGGLLRAEAEQQRRTSADAARRRAESLAVRLMLPLGLCLLPAFVAVGVVPVIAGLLGSVSTAL